MNRSLKESREDRVQFGINQKIWLIVGIPLAGFLMAAILLTITNRKLSDNLTRLGACDYPLSQKSIESLNGYRKQLNLYESAVLLGEEADARSGDDQGTAVLQLLQEMNGLCGGYSAGSGTELGGLVKDYAAYLEQASPLYLKMANGESPGAEFSRLGNLQRELLKRFEEMSKAMIAAVNLLLDRQRAISERNTLYLLTLFGLVLVLSFFAIRLVARKLLVLPAQKIMMKIKDLASGDADLTKQLEVPGRDEIGQITIGFNEFTDKMKNLMRIIKDNSDRLKDESINLARATDDLSQRTSEQAASITETSTTLEMFTSLVRENSENAAEVSGNLNAFNRDVVEKNALIQSVSATMQEIDESSAKIDTIINVINDISFQTNLLALNAAIEAARAGEAGRGFAVVASEVRNLAQKTAESSKTIQEIVTRNVVSSRKGTKLVKETEEFFYSLMSNMQQIVEKVEFISSHSKEQTTGIDQINLAVSQLDSVINQNAKLAESLSAAGRNIESNAGELEEVVGRFKVG